MSDDGMIMSDDGIIMSDDGMIAREEDNADAWMYLYGCIVNAREASTGDNEVQSPETVSTSH